jgi:hypothetical protein
VAGVLIFVGAVVAGIVFWRRRKLRSEEDGSSLLNEDRQSNRSLKSIKDTRDD